MNRGKLPESALKRSVLSKTAKYNRRSKACIGADAGSFSDEGREYLMSSAAIAEEDEGCGTLCITRAINSMAAAGGRPMTAAVSVIAPQEDAENFARRVTQEITGACEKFNVDLISGNTIVGDSASVSVVIMGKRIHDLKAPSSDRERIIIMTGFAGNAGAAMVAEKKRKLLTTRLTEDFIEKAVTGFNELSCVESAARIAESCGGEAAMHDISEGGVFGAVWELMEREGLGCEVYLKDIPIRQATVEVCEILDVSPYQLRGDGGLLAIVCDTPENRELGTVIGVIRNTSERVVINGEEKRFLEPNRYDGYYEICESK